MDKVRRGVTEIVHEMAGGLTGGEEAARAIMTTDKVPKQVALHHSGNWTVGGMAKGAGMLAPSLATMLCVITTDAVADASALDHALRRASALTFDRLDVDGSCSTNDTILVLASGASAIAPSQDELDDALLQVCDDLCAQLQADAEGVTKRVVVTVAGATDEADALTAARVVARDSLVKTALFGSDPNWGRVLAAVGMAPVRLDPERISVSFNGSPVCVDGVGAPRRARCRPVRRRYRGDDRPRCRRRECRGADHRPFACVRRRELGIQLVTSADVAGGRLHHPHTPRPTCSPLRCRG